MTDRLALTDELVATRAKIRRVRIDMSKLAFEAAPWEYRYNTESLLERLLAQEAELATRIEAEDERTDRLVASASRIGHPALAALLYVTFGTNGLEITDPQAA